MSAINLPTTQWLLSSEDQPTQELLARELGISPIISKILTGRNITNTDYAKKYLAPSLRDLHNPFLMQGMQEGVHRLIKAIYSGEKVAIYGDYDADGVTSVVVLLKFLKDIDVPVSYHIPNRIDEGYGLHNKIIRHIKESGVTLLVTVDCGISDFEQVAYAKSLGIDVIILDHHEIPGVHVHIIGHQQFHCVIRRGDATCRVDPRQKIKGGGPACNRSLMFHVANFLEGSHSHPVSFGNELQAYFYKYPVLIHERGNIADSAQGHQIQVIFEVGISPFRPETVLPQIAP